MTSSRFDVIVIGSGPGGYVAAIRASQLGLKTAVVEREHLGGICLNWGCIPTKALLRSGEIYHYMQDASAYGLSATGVKADLSAIVERSRNISGKLNGGVHGLLKKNRISIIWGEAEFVDPHTIQVVSSKKKPMEPQHPIPQGVLKPGRYTAPHIIVATGARPRILSGIEPDGKQILTYFEAMLPKSVPQSMLVIGSGAIGIEFASFYSDLGVDVTVVETMPMIVPAEDEDISVILRKSMESRGLKIMTDCKVNGVSKGSGAVSVHLTLADGTSREVIVERVISAVGVMGNIEGFGLDVIGVKTSGNCIIVDGYGCTNIPGVYAIGDVAGPPMLAHKAEHEGVICVEKIAGLSAVRPMDKNTIPGCTYCHPQIASVGLTEAQATEAGYELKVGRFPFMANGKAIALGEPEGMVKTIFNAKTGQLLGAHMVGAEVTELIQGFVIAMNLETTEEDLLHSVFPHPTLSEMMHESVMDAYGRVIHK